jgi:hypothetical protein
MKRSKSANIAILNAMASESCNAPLGRLYFFKRVLALASRDSL